MDKLSKIPTYSQRTIKKKCLKFIGQFKRKLKAIKEWGWIKKLLIFNMFAFKVHQIYLFKAVTNKKYWYKNYCVQKLLKLYNKNCNESPIKIHNACEISNYSLLLCSSLVFVYTFFFIINITYCVCGYFFGYFVWLLIEF